MVELLDCSSELCPLHFDEDFHVVVVVVVGSLIDYFYRRYECFLMPTKTSRHLTKLTNLFNIDRF